MDGLASKHKRVMVMIPARSIALRNRSAEKPLAATSMRSLSDHPAVGLQGQLSAPVEECFVATTLLTAEPLGGLQDRKGPDAASPGVRPVASG